MGDNAPGFSGTRRRFVFVYELTRVSLGRFLAGWASRGPVQPATQHSAVATTSLCWAEGEESNALTGHVRFGSERTLLAMFRCSCDEIFKFNRQDQTADANRR